MSYFRETIINHLLTMKPHAYNLTQDHCDANDLIQDVALKVLTTERLPDSEDVNNIYGWLHVVMQNVFISKLRAKKYKKNDYSEYVPALTQDFNWKLYELIEVIRFIKRFEEPHQCMFHLRVIGYKYCEIADLFGTTEGLVKSIIFRLRKHLEEFVKNQ